MEEEEEDEEEAEDQQKRRIKTTKQEKESRWKKICRKTECVDFEEESQHLLGESWVSCERTSQYDVLRDKFTAVTSKTSKSLMQQVFHLYGGVNTAGRWERRSSVQ